MFFRVTSANSFKLLSMDIHSATGAVRRRQRRLRQFLRHERLSVATALAEFTHHTAPRRPTMARARGEASDEMKYATGQKTPPPRAASTEYYRMDDDGDVLAPGPHPSLRCGHSRGFCGTLWRTSWISCPSCRSSMILCRRWGGTRWLNS